MWNNNQYILKKSWASISNQAHQTFLENLNKQQIVDEFMHVIGHHPVEEYIDKQKTNLIEMAKTLCSSVYDFEWSMQVYEQGEGLELHNDFYDDNRHRAVRGILWLNPFDVEGTSVYNEKEEPIGSIGGGGGDLLLFLTTKDSYHSAINTTPIPRYTANFTFYNKL